jgi:protein arginine kinase activator
MQQCDNCGGSDAVIQLTTVVNNEMKVSQLCQACAAQKGLDPAPAAASAPLVDFLAQIGKGMGETSITGRCPSCGMTASQLRQLGRLGCTACYDHFEQHLRGLLRRLHGATQHVGKVAAVGDPRRDDQGARIRSLRQKLEHAVQTEDFEHAASLRDQIRRLEVAESEEQKG